MRQRHVMTMVLVLALTWTAMGYAQQTAEELYQAGLYQEEVHGNLEGAIEIYRQILGEFSDSRAVGAKAQLHMGLCYEKLGLQDALQAYQRVIDDYAEHRDEVTVARQRLASLSQVLAELNRQPTFRKVEIASNPGNGVLSPDGSKLAFVSSGSVWVVPVQGNVAPDIAGEPVRIAEGIEAIDVGNLLTWSRDGEWIAVNSQAGGGAVYVVPAGGGEPRSVRMPPRGGHPWSYRLSLSPDGETLAFSAPEIGTSEDVPYIYAVPTRGGEPEQLTFASSKLPAFSQDGELVAYVGYRAREATESERTKTPSDGDLWVVPAAGGTPVKLANVSGQLRGPVWSPDGRFIAAHHEPEAGSNVSEEIWVFPLSSDASSAGEPTKIMLPRLSMLLLAGWTPNDELGVFMRTEYHRAVYTVPASGGKAVQVTPEGISSYPRWSPDGERIYLHWVDRGEGADVTIRLPYVPAAGGELVEVPAYSETQFMSRVPGGGHNVSPDGERIVISAGQRRWEPEGVDVWMIPLNGGRPIRLTSDASYEGYPCWSPDGEWVAFTDWSEDWGFKTIYIIPAEGGEIRQLTTEADSVGGGAIAFSPDGERIAFFSGGAIKTVRLDGGQPEVLVMEVRSEMKSDLVWSPDGSTIAHNAEGKIWITPLDGGAPEELRTGMPENAWLGEFGWSPDGEKIAFVGSFGGEPEFWLISDFLPQ